MQNIKDHNHHALLLCVGQSLRQMYVQCLNIDSYDKTSIDICPNLGHVQQSEP